MKIANVAVHSMEKDGSKVLDWLQDRRPDIVTLQKVGWERDFPTNALCEIGYESSFLGKRSGSDLGVAILSHRNLPQPKIRVPHKEHVAKQEVESRFLTVNIGDLWVSSVYAPFNPDGLKRKQDVIDRRVQWLNRLRDHVYDKDYARQDSMLCGDFNVKFGSDGPRKGLYGQDDEDALQALLDLGFVDLYRKAHPNSKEKPGCTRGYDMKNPQGTARLHLILASKSLAQRLRSVCVAVNSRPWPREDAPPLVANFDGVSPYGVAGQAK